jgi:hypothetical protein
MPEAYQVRETSMAATASVLKGVNKAMSHGLEPKEVFYAYMFLL